MRGAAALRDAAEELVRVAPVDGLEAQRLLADLRGRYRATAAQLGVAHAYAPTHLGADAQHAFDAQRDGGPTPPQDGVVVPRLDEAVS